MEMISFVLMNIFTSKQCNISTENIFSCNQLFTRKIKDKVKLYIEISVF